MTPGLNAQSPEQIPFRTALAVWVRVALLSFGGPAGQMAVMHRILVEEKRWVGEARFLHALNYTMLLPGPEAQQLATYIGWLLHGIPGGLVAGTLFVLPGFVSILALSMLYAGFQDVSFVQALFYGLKPAVMAVVIEAVIRIGRRALHSRVMLALAALAFIAIFFFAVPFPLLVLGGGLVGFVSGRLRAPAFQSGSLAEGQDEAEPGYGAIAGHTQPSLRRAASVLAVCLALWFTPLLWLAVSLGPDHVFTQIGVFFSKAAVVTFGGAYAVLAYITQEAVNTYGWLQPGEMLDGLGMAETTPGPLIQVVQFVGFMGAYRDSGSLTPLQAGVLGSVLTTWVTFVPCFLWIFLGAPYVERLRGKQALSAALSGITAVVVGVVLNVAIWFALHTLFADVAQLVVGPLRLYVPDLATLDPVALLIATGAFIALFRFRASMLLTLGGAALAGLIYYLLARV